MAPSECHGSNYKWDNGIFTPSFNREGEVASIPLPQREEQRQAFSKERGAGKQGRTDNLLPRGNVHQVHPASNWDSVSGQVPHSQQVQASLASKCQEKDTRSMEMGCREINCELIRFRALGNLFVFYCPSQSKVLVTTWNS